MDRDGPEGEGRLTALLDGAARGDRGGGPPEPADAYRLTADDVREVADALDPGASAGFIIFEHLWARDLKQAIVDTDGVAFAEGFLAPDAVAALGG